MAAVSQRDRYIRSLRRQPAVGEGGLGLTGVDPGCTVTVSSTTIIACYVNFTRRSAAETRTENFELKNFDYCSHPADKAVVKEGQTVCTVCGLCTGCFYDVTNHRFEHTGSSVPRKHYYRPEAYLRVHIAKLGGRLPHWAARRLYDRWPYIIRVFRAVVREDSGNKKRKNMICYSFVIEQLLRRWDVDCTGLHFKPIKTAARRREINRLWGLMSARFSDHL